MGISFFVPDATATLVLRFVGGGFVFAALVEFIVSTVVRRVILHRNNAFSNYFSGMEFTHTNEESENNMEFTYTNEEGEKFSLKIN